MICACGERVHVRRLDEEPADIKELEYFSQRVVTNVTTWCAAGPPTSTLP